MLRNCIFASFMVLSPGLATAQGLTENECSELGTAFRALVGQNLAVAELREDMAGRMLQAMAQNTVEADREKQVLESIDAELKVATVASSDLGPGIQVYRKHCID